MSDMSNALPEFETWLQDGAGPAAHAGLPWLEKERSQALERARQKGLPTSKEEGWRYTSLKSLVEKRFARGEDHGPDVAQEDLDPLLVPGLDAHRAVLVNGRFAPHLSDLRGLPEGVRAGSLREMLKTAPGVVEGRLNQVAREGGHLFSALNTAGIDDGFVLLIDASVVVDRPIEILHLSVDTGQPRVAQPRYLVVLDQGAGATLIERYVGKGAPTYCTNALLEVALEPDAVLNHFRLQTEGPNAYHLTGLFLSQAQGSRYRGLNMGLGAAWSRSDLVVRFSGLHAECDLRGLYMAGDKQLVDYHLDMDHGVPHCTSRESFKGILYGKGRAVFDGRIHVARDAAKTDAQLSNRNLLLSRSAEVDTKPQLEIFADDVKCSHGTTVGQIDLEALYYLRTRGIPDPAARRILCLGFAGEIIDAVEPAPLREYLAGQVGQRLEQIEV